MWGWKYYDNILMQDEKAGENHELIASLDAFINSSSHFYHWKKIGMSKAVTTTRYYSQIAISSWWLCFLKMTKILFCLFAVFRYVQKDLDLTYITPRLVGEFVFIIACICSKNFLFIDIVLNAKINKKMKVFCQFWKFYISL